MQPLCSSGKSFFKCHDQLRDVARVEPAGVQSVDLDDLDSIRCVAHVDYEGGVGHPCCDSITDVGKEHLVDLIRVDDLVATLVQRAADDVTHDHPEAVLGEDDLRLRDLDQGVLRERVSVVLFKHDDLALPFPKCVTLEHGTSEYLAVLDRANERLRPVEVRVLECVHDRVVVEHLGAPLLSLHLEGARLQVEDPGCPDLPLRVVPHGVRAHANHVLVTDVGLGDQITNEWDDLVDGVGQLEPLERLEENAIGCFVEEVVLKDPMHDRLYHMRLLSLIFPLLSEELEPREEPGDELHSLHLLDEIDVAVMHPWYQHGSVSIV